MRIFLPQRRYHPIWNQQNYSICQDRDSHILVHYQPSYNTSHAMKPSDPLLQADVTLCCGMYCAGKVDISQRLPSSGSPRVTVLSASPVQTLVHSVVKYSRRPDLKSSWMSASHLLGLQGPQQTQAVPIVVGGKNKSKISNHCSLCAFAFQI